MSYVFGHVPRPTLFGIKSDNPNWPAILAVEQIDDDGLEAGVVIVRLGPCSSNTPVVIEH